MSTQRITVSVPTDIAIRVKRAARRTGSVSEWVTSAVTRALDEEDLKRRFLEFCDAVKSDPADERRAKVSFDRITRGREGARAKAERRRARTAA